MDAPTTPDRSARRIWEHAPGVIERLELSVGQVDLQSICRESLREILALAGWERGCLRLVSASSDVLLAGEGEDSHHGADPRNAILIERVLPIEATLRLELRPESIPTPELSDAIRQAGTAILGVVSEPILDDEFHRIRMESVRLSEHLDILERLAGDNDPDHRLWQIAEAIAVNSNSDRVCLLISDEDSWRLRCSSVQPRPDGKARVTLAIERLVGELAKTQCDEKPIKLSPDHATSLLQQDYFEATGASATRVHFVHSSTEEPARIVAAIVMEDFATKEASSEIDSVTTRVFEAAIRDAVTMRHPSTRVRALRFLKKRSVLVAAALMMIFTAACFWPVPLRIPSDGILAPRVTQEVFSPADAVVVEQLVADGDRVKTGDVLARLKSDELDLRESNSQGELSTTAASLNVLSIQRVDGDDRNDAGKLQTSGQREVLRKKQQFQQEQLKRVAEQKAKLVLRSSVDGVVHLPQLESSLESKPVRYGELLMRVEQINHLWTARLMISDENIGYVRSVADQPVETLIRIRSRPGESKSATLDRIATTASLDRHGELVVQAEADFELGPEDVDTIELTSGASLVAEIKCGHRPLGFVLFRQLIQRGRINGWW